MRFVKIGHDKLVLVIYVDKGIIDLRKVIEIEELLNYLENKIKIRKEPLKRFLGIKIKRELNGSILISQQNYIQKILSSTNVTLN